MASSSHDVQARLSLLDRTGRSTAAWRDDADTIIEGACDVGRLARELLGHATGRRPRRRAVATPLPPHTMATNSGIAHPRAIQTAVPNGARLDLTAKVLDQIAKLLVAGSWNGLSTVEALRDKHGLPVAEIERLHALAAGKVKNARGALGAQLEAAVAATHWIFKDESETAARYREEAGKLFEAKDYAGARAASKIATASHRLALEARKHLDEMTVKKPPTVAIHVAVPARPDFAAAFTIVAMILDGLYGACAAARVERGLGVWEDMYAAGASEAQAREAVAAWIAEENATIMTAGEAVEARG